MRSLDHVTNDYFMSISDYCHLKRITKSKFAQDLGVTPQSLNVWISSSYVVFIETGFIYKKIIGEIK